MKKSNEKNVLNDTDFVQEVVAAENIEQISAEEVNEIMAKYDRESAVRIFSGNKALLIKLMLVAFTIFAVSINTFVHLNAQIHRSTFIAIVLFLAYLLYPAKKNAPKNTNKVPVCDIIFAFLSAGSFLYMGINYKQLVAQAGSYTQIDIAIAILAIVLLFEACRRVVGTPILVVVGCFIAYAYFGNMIPGTFGHRGFTFQRIATHLYFTTEGIIGTPLAVCSTFIFLFILFGAFLERTGVGQFFIDIANSIAGKATGGPAKVAVISSALQGMITGSSVANTVGSGSFTIPMMKRMGYRPEFAAAVEAAASTGGQIMPPIMGAAAFLMAEMTGIPYSNIVIAAIIPAFLYFSGIMIMVHLEAKRYGLKGLPPEEIPNFFKLMFSYWYLLLPLIVLVSMMMTGYTPARSALVAIVVAIVVSMFRKETRMSLQTFIDALEAGARNIIGVAIACSVAGCIVGIVTLTGIGLKLAGGLLALSGGNVLLALFFTMIASIVLGMGVPTTANYVIMATITAPVVLQLGIDLLPAHMFVFYFGIVADITPPVALAAYAGSAIARSNPLKTGVQATKLAIAAFIIPYVFALNPSLLLLGSTPIQVISVAITAFIGMFGVASAVEGYVFTNMNPVLRVVSLVGGLLLIIPGAATDIAGVILVLAAMTFQKARSKKANSASSCANC
ncbi:MAG: TRAP transporter permease [Peptococcaceae bacterium]|nr:TRAP transporter permease [Peptococcaceae bacterium]